MTREEFQRLLSAWLDEPERRELRLAVARALRKHRELRVEFAAWRRVDELVRAMKSPPSHDQPLNSAAASIIDR